MKGSKYDTDKNGTCGAKECKNVLMIVDTRAVDTKMLPVIVAAREEDRHHLRGADGRGCVPDHPEPVEEHPDRGAPRLG